MIKKLTLLLVAILTSAALYTTPDSLNKITDDNYTLGSLTNKFVEATHTHILNGRNNYNATYETLDNAVTKIASAFPKTTKAGKSPVKAEG